MMTEENSINMTSPAGRKADNGVLPVPPGREPVLCSVRPGGHICGMGSHGFICTFADGTCLRHPKATTEE